MVSVSLNAQSCFQYSGKGHQLNLAIILLTPFELTIA